MKLCFITALFGKSHDEIDQITKFKKNDSYDYYLFTNLLPDGFNTSWKVITLEPNNFGISITSDPMQYKISKHIITSNIIKSRYPKFMGKKILKDILNKEYDVIFYCDACWAPKYNANWEHIANSILKHPSGIMVQPHIRGAYAELRSIIRSRKDNKNRCNATHKYLIENNFPKGKLMPENMCFGYNPNNLNLQNAFTDFWNKYSKYEISHRDQPLWSYILWKHNINPLLYNKMYRKMLDNLFDRVGNNGFNGHKYA